MTTLPRRIAEAESDDYLQALVRHAESGAEPTHAAGSDGDEKWKTVRRQVTAQNLFLMDELHQVLEKLQAAGIEVIVLKGAALTEGLYPHLGLRAFADIDLLVHREKVSEVIDILGSLGYSSPPPFRPGAEDFLGEVACVKRGKLPVMIEPHWILSTPHLHSGEVDITGIWERARKARIAGFDTLVLCPEDLLTHLCLHPFKHCQSGWLTSACDITELIRHDDDGLDWQAFLDRVFEARICLPVRYSLHKTITRFQPPIPPSVLERLDAYQPGKFERWTFTLFESSSNPDGSGLVLAQLLRIPGATLKMRYMRDLLFPARDYMLDRYAISRPGLLPFYHVLRLTKASWMALKALVAAPFKLLRQPRS